jgi:hypothetical protein
MATSRETILMAALEAGYCQAHAATGTPFSFTEHQLLRYDTIRFADKNRQIAERDEVIPWLTRYVEHKHTCYVNSDFAGPRECTCGLSEALAAADRLSSRKEGCG